MTDLIYIVIINWNLKQDTADCIDSLLQANADLKRITVVDNGSTDGSVAFLIERFGEDLGIAALSENLGFAKGSNVGIERAMQEGAEWIFLMNNDTVIAPDFLAALEKAILIGKSEYDLFSPLILYFNEPDRIWYLGDRLVPGTMISTNPYTHKKASELDLPVLVPSDFINGCGMLVNRKVYEKVGMMDTSLFIYHEEVDFCWRARQAGFKAASVPGARMWHKISSIMGKQKPRARYLQTRNQIWVYRRYSIKLQRIVMFMFSILRAMRLLLYDLRMKQVMVLFPHMWRGWWEGWTANPHQGEY